PRSRLRRRGSGCAPRRRRLPYGAGADFGSTAPTKCNHDAARAKRLTLRSGGNYRRSMRTSPSRAAAPRPAALALVLFILGGCGSGDGETCRVEQPLEACAIAPGTGLSRPSANPAPEPTDCTGLSEECLLPFPSAAFLREDE